MAKRIDHRGVKLPSPKRKTLEAMAVASSTAFANTLGLELNVEMRDWESLNPSIQVAWYDASRAAYAVLAMVAGATVEDVPGIKDDDEQNNG